MCMMVVTFKKKVEWGFNGVVTRWANMGETWSAALPSEWFRRSYTQGEPLYHRNSTHDL